MITKLTTLDAFKALEDIEDEDFGLSSINEGKDFSVHSPMEMKEAEEYRQPLDKEPELEVIDVDADALEHLKNGNEYVGDYLLLCKTCNTPHFVKAEALVDSGEKTDAGEDIYNIEDECPHCGQDSMGYILMGQVGAVKEEEPEIENDSLTANDEVSFDNDVEEQPAEEPAEEEAPAEEAEEAAFNADEDVFQDEEKNGDETEFADDTEEGEDTYGEEVKVSDDVEYDDTEEKPAEEEKAESEEDENELKVHDEEEEEKKEKKESLTEDVEPVLPESLSVAELFEKFVEPESLRAISVYNFDSEEPDKWVFKGKYAEMPSSLFGAEVVGFHAEDCPFTVVVDSGKEMSELDLTLADALSLFNDDFTSNLIIWDDEVGDELYEGTKETAIEDFGNLPFVSYEVPARLDLQCRGVSLDEALKTPYVESLDYSDPEDKLIADIIHECGLRENNVEHEGTTENAIAESIYNKEDLKDVFYGFVFNKSDALINEFKDVTGFVTEAEEAQKAEHDRYFDQVDIFELEDEEELPEKPNAQSNKEDMEKAVAQAETMLKADPELYAVIYGFNDKGIFYTIDPVTIKSLDAQDVLKLVVNNLETKWAKPHATFHVRFRDGIKEARKFTSRRELGEAIQTCENNNEPFVVKSFGKGVYGLLSEALHQELVEEKEELTEEKAEVKESLYDILVAKYGEPKGKVEISNEVKDDEMEFDEALFEDFINNYLDENVEETTLFETLSGNFTDDGIITLSGKLITESAEMPVTFTLTPSKTLNESTGEETLSYTVTNSVSEEVLSYKGN